MAGKKTDRIKKSPIVLNALLIAATLAVLLIAASIVLRAVTRHGSHLTVPDFAGMHLSEAERLAASQGLHIIVNDSLYVPVFDGGAVLDQLPKGGAEVKAGRKIYVTVNSSRQKSVKVPYVAERSLRQAKNMLESSGLEIERLEYVDDIATNYVLEQYLGGRRITPDTYAEAEMGTGIILVVGVQEEMNSAYIPKVIGLTLSRAKSRLWEMGFNVGRISYDAEVERLERANARVYYQSLGQGRSANLGAAVDLTLTCNLDKIAEREAASDAELQQLLRERAAMERTADSLREAGLDPQPAMEGHDGASSAADDDDDFFR